ncbi:hypothetical protein BCR44DRAFT_38691 [Catenaria anguillulae PL171]|uniref:Uncharacterized protein n=1 Tax=Catenaria anguillulae PL171 TaxID=765915 RepID=A0A1Y2HFA6_9FUNG|nr:hypothetical protein BCR44DRAFT_38691 [Catenaria anguillulae PL171]
MNVRNGVVLTLNRDNCYLWRHKNRPLGKFHTAVPGSESADHAAPWHIASNAAQGQDRLILLVSGDGSFEVMESLQVAALGGTGITQQAGPSAMAMTIAHSVNGSVAENELQPLPASRAGWTRWLSSRMEVEVVLAWMEMLLTGFDPLRRQHVNAKYVEWQGEVMGKYRKGSW